jgi:NAD(P)-dependent dehydrogenase (short-subunit alcohol dehydrogenase family)
VIEWHCWPARSIISERRLRGEGGVALVLPADHDAVAVAAATAADELGPVDLLMNNAAVIQPVGETVSTALSAWSPAFAVNVDAPIRLAPAFFSLLRTGRDDDPKESERSLFTRLAREATGQTWNATDA